MGVQLVNSHLTNKANDSNDLVELAQQIQMADTFVHATAKNKLTAIAEQIKALQEQAKNVLEEARLNSDLHHAACNMVKKPGAIYYLYKRPSGQKYLSLLSPQEWGSSCPHTFIGGYRLEVDQSWTPVENISEKDNESELMDKILHSGLALTNT
ncbi:hypothetical protein NP493_96g13036 [Ridgeia piscesae]|uniref:DUF2452 domain-containing protein n=1 Tax=Ridgeia piscesae TaxID=27915 RepID=A0AAD9UHK7_RIDPI|nr:hypothetical protein NP493_96g13036 [Ridgeia piscesae]